MKRFVRCNRKDQRSFCTSSVAPDYCNREHVRHRTTFIIHPYVSTMPSTACTCYRKTFGTDTRLEKQHVKRCLFTRGWSASDKNVTRSSPFSPSRSVCLSCHLSATECNTALESSPPCPWSSRCRWDRSCWRHRHQCRVSVGSSSSTLIERFDSASVASAKCKRRFDSHRPLSAETVVHACWMIDGFWMF